MKGFQVFPTVQRLMLGSYATSDTSPVGIIYPHQIDQGLTLPGSQPAFINSHGDVPYFRQLSADLSMLGFCPNRIPASLCLQSP